MPRSLFLLPGSMRAPVSGKKKGPAEPALPYRLKLGGEHRGSEKAESSPGAHLHMRRECSPCRTPLQRFARAWSLGAAREVAYSTSRTSVTQMPQAMRISVAHDVMGPQVTQQVPSPERPKNLRSSVGRKSAAWAGALTGNLAATTRSNLSSTGPTAVSRISSEPAGIKPVPLTSPRSSPESSRTRKEGLSSAPPRIAGESPRAFSLSACWIETTEPSRAAKVTAGIARWPAGFRSWRRSRTSPRTRRSEIGTPNASFEVARTSAAVAIARPRTPDNAVFKAILLMTSSLSLEAASWRPEPPNQIIPHRDTFVSTSWNSTEPSCPFQLPERRRNWTLVPGL